MQLNYLISPTTLFSVSEKISNEFIDNILDMIFQKYLPKTTVIKIEL